jgi:hypothetical protein
MRRRLAPLALVACLGCAPDESSVGAVFRAEPRLAAATFDGRDFQRPSGVYQDANIDFEGWQLNERILARGHVPLAVSIRWSGQIWFERAETYTLSFELRGRVRLWIEDSLVIDDWVDSGALREPRGMFAAPARGWRDLRIEWDQLDGPMDARLRTDAASQPRAIVPPRDLRHLEP